MMSFTALLKTFRTWERPAQMAFALAALLLIPAIFFAARAPTEWRVWGIASVMALVIAAQLVFMWANRGMVTFYTQSQRHYLAEDFEAASALLETLRGADKADVHALTLLGNTYRQLGRLPDSKAVLLEALDIQPDLHFPLYGFGRTLLSEGNYTQAADYIQRALAHGAPPIIQFDLGEAYFRAGKMDKAAEALRQALPFAQNEPHRALMGHYMRYQMGAETKPPAPDLIHSGLAYWQRSAAQFAHTPYGAALKEDIHHMSHFIKTLM